MVPFAFLLALLAQPAASTAPQPDWRPLGVANDGSRAGYDPASVIRDGPVTRIRMRFDSAHGFMLSTVELRCAAYESRMLGLASYAEDGRQLNRDEVPTPFRVMVPGSSVEALAETVCAATQAPAQPR